MTVVKRPAEDKAGNRKTPRQMNVQTKIGEKGVCVQEGRVGNGGWAVRSCGRESPALGRACQREKQISGMMPKKVFEVKPRGGRRKNVSEKNGAQGVMTK